MWAQLYFVLTQITSLTDGRSDVAFPSLYRYAAR